MSKAVTTKAKTTYYIKTHHGEASDLYWTIALVCFNMVSLLAHGVVVAQQVLILLVVVRFYMGLPSFNGVEASMVMQGTVNPPPLARLVRSQDTPPVLL